jgi:orotidine-5'-phosphate decarboxylase
MTKQTIPRVERLIVALDVAGVEEAKALVQRLGDSVSFYKVGLELFMADGFFNLTDWLRRQGRRCSSI